MLARPTVAIVPATQHRHHQQPPQHLRILVTPALYPNCINTIGVFDSAGL